jgi:hypothetical protein
MEWDSLNRLDIRTPPGNLAREKLWRSGSALSPGWRRGEPGWDGFGR